MSGYRRPGMLRLDVTDAMAALDHVRARVERGDAAEVPVAELRQAAGAVRFARARADRCLAQLNREIRSRGETP